MTTTTGPRTLTLWRDHDHEVNQQTGASAGAQLQLGPAEAGVSPADLAAKLYRGGTRRVALDRPADLSGRTDAQSLISTMLLLSELTSWGIAVDWDVMLGKDPEIWQSLNHIYPPRAVLDAADGEDIRKKWQATFYICKCVYRRGPGFIQVRDRRGGSSLYRFTIDDLTYLDAVDRLSTGCPADDVPAAVLNHLVTESLAGRAGPLAWWLPYRVRRWPWPSFAV